MTAGKSMTVGIELGSIIDEVGTADFFHAFFSTISGNLEPKGWGSRFPVLMNRLYQGKMTQSDADAALAELDRASAELAKLPVSKVIWDVEDRSKTPPWGNNIAKTITDLSNYFVTSTGRDLIELLREVLVELKDAGGVAKVVNY
jgi:2,3-bisphosphoglycerate-dependent phosphoglycerate mutase